MASVSEIAHDPREYPYADTVAARMLAEAFDAIRNKQSMSQRKLATKLGYRSSVPLSHMASGRVPIPVSRVTNLSVTLEIDEAALLLAVLDQRYPEIEFQRILQMTG